ncbi:MAG: DUF1289 domain-containing protein [Burkholderiales bacterium]
MADNVPSPCINQCVLDEETQLCLGCYRNIEEITLWGNYSDAEKKQVLEQIGQRKNTRAKTAGK